MRGGPAQGKEAWNDRQTRPKGANEYVALGGAVRARHTRRGLSQFPTTYVYGQSRYHAVTPRLAYLG